jgi:hypothetical protein
MVAIRFKFLTVSAYKLMFVADIRPGWGLLPDLAAKPDVSDDSDQRLSEL